LALVFRSLPRCATNFTSPILAARFVPEERAVVLRAEDLDTAAVFAAFAAAMGTP
jgi:hypothetical protein